MKIIKVNYNNPDPKVIKMAAQVVRKGGVVVSSGDVIYAMIADAFNQKAIQKVFRLKKRYREKAFNIGLSCWEDVAKYGKFDPIIYEIMKRFPDEPFSFAMPRNNKTVPRFLNPGFKTLGFRVSCDKVISSIAKLVGTPWIATSANISEFENTYSTEEVLDYFGSVFDCDISPDIVLDGGKLSTRRRASTVVEIVGKNIKVIRDGEIQRELLEREIKKIVEKLDSKKHENPRY